MTPPYPDKQYDIESLQFVYRIKLQDQIAWRQLHRAYSSPLKSVITAKLIDASMPLEIDDILLEDTWDIVRKQIRQFRFQQIGDLFTWLCQVVTILVDERRDAYLTIENDKFIDLLKRKDDVAWMMLHNEYEKILANVSRSKLLAKGVSLGDYSINDIMQETWTLAIERIGNFKLEHEGGLLGWLCKIQANHTLNHYRRAWMRRYVPLEDIQEYVADEQQTIESVIQLSANEEAAIAYNVALAKIISNSDKLPIPTDLRQRLDRSEINTIIIERLKNNKKPNMIATQLGVNVTDVYTLTRLSKQALKQMLTRYISQTDDRDQSLPGTSTGD